MIANRDNELADEPNRPENLHENAETVVGVFADGASIERALFALRDAGYNRDDLALVGRGTVAGEEIPNQAASDNATEGAVAGAAIGGISGAALAILSGATALAIPGIGPVLVAIGGALFGAAAGGWLGSMAINAPNDVQERYADLARQGDYLLFVRVGSEDQSRRVTGLLCEAGATETESFPYTVQPPEINELPGGTQPGAQP